LRKLPHGNAFRGMPLSTAFRGARQESSRDESRREEMGPRTKAPKTRIHLPERPRGVAARFRAKEVEKHFREVHRPKHHQGPWRKHSLWNGSLARLLRSPGAGPLLVARRVGRSEALFRCRSPTVLSQQFCPRTACNFSRVNKTVTPRVRGARPALSGSGSHARFRRR